MKLLIAEDDPRLLKSLIYIFQNNKYIVDGVSDGDAALDYALTGDYDGIVLDVMMPKKDGIVVESNPGSYLFQRPYILMPEMEASDITDSLIAEKYYAIMPLSMGMTVGSTGNGTVTPLLTTTYDSFSKAAGFGLSTYEKEEGDINGPFSVAVSVTDNGGGQIVWFSSSEFIADMYNAYSSGANGDMVMNALASMIGESEAMAIRSKSLNYNYLTISDSTSSLLKTLMIGVFPVAYIGIGAAVILIRRRKQNESN